MSQTLKVTNNNDSGEGSLRDAIAEANNNPGEDRIEFDSDLTRETITLTSGELVITDDLIISGLGEEQLVIKQEGSEEVFIVDDQSDTSRTVEIDNLTIQGGGREGSIVNQEDLTIRNSQISGGDQVGIFNRGSYNYYASTRRVIPGTLTITNSTISGHQQEGIVNSGEMNIDNSLIADNQGTGIRNTKGGNDVGGSYLYDLGIATINNSTISGNSGRTGGIYNGGEMEINNSTITDNTGSQAGGIHIVAGTEDSSMGTSSSASTLIIKNSTISGNSSEQGGGIYYSYFYDADYTDPATLKIYNTTITKNESETGGGIFSNYGFTINTLANSIIAGNSGEDIRFDYGDGNINSLGGNILGVGDFTPSDVHPQDQVGIEDPLLGPLGHNGGLTETHLPQPGSPAINGGLNDLIPSEITRDQRGLSRISDEIVDSGSVEVQPLLEVIMGTAGNDRLQGGPGDEQINGLAGQDTLQGLKGNDFLEGRKGKDLLIGDEGNDRLVGGSGSDRLVGRSGDDLLNGGVGKDKFQFTSYNDGVDTIRDFDPELDRIRISQTGFSDRLDLGTLPESFYTSVANLEELDPNIQFGFVYDRSDGSLAFLDLDNQVSLTTIAILENQPELAPNHLRVF